MTVRAAAQNVSDSFFNACFISDQMFWRGWCVAVAFHQTIPPLHSSPSFWACAACWPQWKMFGHWVLLVLCWTHTLECIWRKKNSVWHQPKIKVMSDLTICGRVTIWGHCRSKNEIATICNSPAKNKYVSRHVFIFVVAVASMMWCPVITYNTTKYMLSRYLVIMVFADIIRHAHIQYMGQKLILHIVWVQAIHCILQKMFLWGIIVNFEPFHVMEMVRSAHIHIFHGEVHVGNGGIVPWLPLVAVIWKIGHW